MSVVAYDEALLTKLQNWIKDDTIKITSPNETRRLFEYKADITNDKPIELPLITLRREPTVTLNSKIKKPLSFDGYRQNGNITPAVNKVSQLNAIPITVSYQLDIYTRYNEEAEEYLRNFVFNIINFPKLKIKIPYNGANIEHISNIWLAPELQDNSEIPERLVPGQFTRKTISLQIDDAYYFDYKIKDCIKICDEDIDIKVVLQDDEKED